jgi:uncharacterized protein (DUF1501 family)
MADNPSTSFLPTTRREFLRRSGQGLGLVAFSRFAPSFLVRSALGAAPAPEKDRSVLVLVQLAGGNDGLNTVIPFEDDNYRRLRPTLGIPKEQVLPISATLGLHPSCRAMAGLFQDGKLAIVQNVGYPNPNRSHFRSTEIWETASASSTFAATGWIGRYLDNRCAGTPAEGTDPLAVHLNTLNGEPVTFVGEQAHPTYGFAGNGVSRRDDEESSRLLESLAASPGAINGADSFLKQTLMDGLVTETKVQRLLGAYLPGASYPANQFGASLKNVAALIAGGLPTRVYFVTLNGFDTHVNQLATQAGLLQVLADGLAAFQSDLEAHHLDGQVLTMTFSEFGRRASENESRGTDHGTASPLFVLGGRVRGGCHGTAPNLNLPRNQDLTYSTDFRGVYATVLDQWLGCPSDQVLGGRFGALPILA